MPYDETPRQARTYFDIAKEKLEEGNKGEARNMFNLAKNIARKNGMDDLMSLIQSYLDSL